MSDSVISESLKSTIGNAKSANELFRAGQNNPGYKPNDSDFSSNEARTSFFGGQKSGS